MQQRLNPARRVSRHFTIVKAVLFLAASAAASDAFAQGPRRVFITDIEGAIGVATVRQLSRAVQRTQRDSGEALLVRMDTPGGLVSSTREIIKNMIASPVPIIVYVAPSGARAASAGTFILYASHVAAMAPGTNLGAATPIQIGGAPGLPGQPAEPDEKQRPAGGDAGERKAVNDAVALLRSLAQLRGRDPDFAERAVIEAATLTANEALAQRVVEIVAPTLESVLQQADGRKVTVDGVERDLRTKDAQQEFIEIDWRTRLLAIITDPNIAFILLMLGFYGLIFEFWSPGVLVPGVVGGICIILALIGLAALPIHFGALALLLLGIAMMVAEAFSPGIGILGIGGLVAFAGGSIFLFEGPDAGVSLRVSTPVIVSVTATTAVLIFAIVGAAIRVRKRPSLTGSEELVGMRATVNEWEGREGLVHVRGETWMARSEMPLSGQTSVRVVGREGLTLIVEP